MNRSYPTDLTDAEWEAFEPHVPATKKRGRPRTHSAKVPEQDGLRLLLRSAHSGLSRLKHLWLDAGYEGRGTLGGPRRQWV